MLQRVSAEVELRERIQQHLDTIYAEVPPGPGFSDLAEQLLQLMRLDQFVFTPEQQVNHWSQRDAVVITYGESIQETGVKPLRTLKRFLDEYSDGALNGVHVLPFCPWSSDDGFAVLDYSSVNEALGDWGDIQHLAGDYHLMADLVINHCSGRSLWFENFIAGRDPGKDYFYTASLEDDLSQVVRPRTSPLLREVETANGIVYVWCTFSHDQIDFDFRNPEVLKQFVSILRLYLDMGVRIFRLDAVAFLWKKPGTNCINLQETHEIVRLLRTLVEHARPDAILITETNIPNQENLSYFGNANEGHCVYNFSLPPLLVNSLVTGSCQYLKQWMMSMPPSRNGTAYFNFIASHDGIGLRPAEGLLSDEELETLIKTMQAFGGVVSWRALETGESRPYEINIALYDALQGTVDGPDQWGLDRFVCAHAIMLGLEGIPGIYIHSLLGTRNDYHRMEGTGIPRSINRHQWRYDELQGQLNDRGSTHARVFRRLKDLLLIRRRQAAFHPNATQFTLHLGDAVFGFWRQSMDRQQSIFCLSNISCEPQEILLSAINLIEHQEWIDLISGRTFVRAQEKISLEPYTTLWITNAPDHQ